MERYKHSSQENPEMEEKTNYLEKIMARNLMAIIHAAPILQNLMINGTLDSVSKLQDALVAAEVHLSGLPKDSPFQNFEQRSPLFPCLLINSMGIGQFTLYFCITFLAGLKSGASRKDGEVLQKVLRRQ
jgi:hypothetical protein